MRLVTGLYVVAMLTWSTAAEAALTSVPSFGVNPGNLEMFEYVPAGLPAGSPLVVVLHGCTQTAAAMETADWNALADDHHFAVLYPQQKPENQSLRCFTWFADGDQQRGAGEPASVVAMIDTMIADHGVTRDRIYVTGLIDSSLAASWPACPIAARATSPRRAPASR